MNEAIRRGVAHVNPKHQQPTRIIDQPEPGFFKMRRSAKHVWVGARITYGPVTDPTTGKPQVERSFLWSGEINGEPDPGASPAPSALTMRIWLSGEQISEADYRYLIEDRAWAAEHAPHLPEANPHRAVDLSTLDPRSLFPRRTA